MRFSRFLGLLLIISATISMGNSSAQNQIEPNNTSRYLEPIQPQPYGNTTNINIIFPTLALVAAKNSYDSGYNAFEQGNYDLAKNLFGEQLKIQK